MFSFWEHTNAHGHFTIEKLFSGGGARGSWAGLRNGETLVTRRSDPLVLEALLANDLDARPASRIDLDTRACGLPRHLSEWRWVNR